MEPDWDESVIEDLPCEAVGTSLEDYATSDSDESVKRRRIRRLISSLATLSPENYGLNRTYKMFIT
ncbi:hypothetical protein K435DRAFT_881552 [Dendrothele bispora CBS 962.96]|uniref:Uncharacterized protein n=1 Tax=Dendrothele bispora (strain CBS 962.96) TaxID=1314807 RepID=A0A4S8KJ61_DENBC|nr:hypothetical protein K435DRAFT_881552 [Dendrothele bispora CBS 962.96]